MVCGWICVAFIGLHFANGDNGGLPWEAAQSRTHYCLMELSPTNCIWRPLPLEWPRYRFKFWGNVSYYLCQNVKEGDFWDNCMIDQSDLTEHDITWPWPLAIEKNWFMKKLRMIFLCILILLIFENARSTQFVRGFALYESWHSNNPTSYQLKIVIRFEISEEEKKNRRGFSLNLLFFEENDWRLNYWVVWPAQPQQCIRSIPRSSLFKDAGAAAHIKWGSNIDISRMKDVLFLRNSTGERRNWNTTQVH